MVRRALGMRPARLSSSSGEDELEEEDSADKPSIGGVIARTAGIGCRELLGVSERAVRSVLVVLDARLLRVELARESDGGGLRVTTNEDSRS